MANSSLSDEQNQLRRRAKRRLLGAIILVTALVVFLPMVLDDEPKPVSDDIAINIPSQDSKGPTSLSPKIAPLAAAPKPEPIPEKAKDTPAAEPAAVQDAATAPPIQAVVVPPGGQPVKPPALADSKLVLTKIEPAKPANAQENPKPHAGPAESPKAPVPAANPPKHAEPAKPALKADPVKEVKPAEKPAAKPEPVKEAKPAAPPSQGGFVVRLGAFAMPENAKQLKARLTALGIRNYSDVMKTPSGDKHRVRAGPYATRKEAEAARDRLKAANLVGDVVAKP